MIQFKKNDGFSTDNEEVSMRDENASYEIKLQISAQFILDGLDDLREKEIMKKWTDKLASFARPLISEITLRSGYVPVGLPRVES